MRYLSLCSGIEAVSLAWHPLGWDAAAYAEIEPFPCAVLAHHYPNTPNLGDITKHADWPDIGPIDLLAGGTPCQAFSVAGKRGGIEDARGNLALTFCDIADKYQPDWTLWENVPGVLSDKSNAFGCFLGRLCGADSPVVPDGGKWTGAGVVSGPSRTVAWRILDAQYSGVPQRRRRVFVLAVPGARNWRCAAALFPVGDGLRWHPPARGEAGKAVAALTSTGVGTCGADDNQAQAGHVVPAARSGQSGDVANCLTRREGKGPDSDATTTLVCAPLTASPYADNEAQESKLVPMAFRHFAGPTDTGVPQEDIAPALRAADTAGLAIVFDTTKVTSAANRSNPRPGDPCHPLASGAHAPAVAFNLRGREGGAMPEMDPDGLACQRAASGGSSRSYVAQYGVRRLTPVECARLQGFPDDWLDITFRGKPAADGNKYKALGNSMAVPVLAWIGRRIDFVRRNYA